MRSRKEIQEHIPPDRTNTMIDVQQEHILEVLLDIRELLEGKPSRPMGVKDRREVMKDILGMTDADIDAIDAEKRHKEMFSAPGIRNPLIDPEA